MLGEPLSMSLCPKPNFLLKIKSFKNIQYSKEKEQCCYRLTLLPSQTLPQMSAVQRSPCEKPIYMNLLCYQCLCFTLMCFLCFHLRDNLASQFMYIYILFHIVFIGTASYIMPIIPPNTSAQCNIY